VININGTTSIDVERFNQQAERQARGANFEAILKDMKTFLHIKKQFQVSEWWRV